MFYLGLVVVLWSFCCNVDGDFRSRFLPPDHEQIFEFLSGSSASAGCWGFEPGCRKENRLRNPVCEPGTKKGDAEAFFSEADFGYIGDKLATLDHLCRPEKEGDSELLCSQHLQFCTGREIRIDLTNFPKNANRLIQYDMNVLKYGEISGRCRVRNDFVVENSNYMSPLQSWAPEMRNFVNDEGDIRGCDVTIERPVIVMKLDAAVNMYHHFCDFFNLYASLLLNATLDPGPDGFSRDVHVLIWENQRYRSSLEAVFSVFTRHEIWNLNTFAGKKVCLKKAVFPFLPRMVFGLFYNTPFSTEKCRNSGLFRSFADFITYRMNVHNIPKFTEKSKVRVTILNRLTPHRNILNLGDLVDKLNGEARYSVTVANFTHWRPHFKHQMEIIRQTDILVGIHGAGLSHMLFLPEWAAVFELYDCEDPECYRDLSRLRGLKHITWTDREKLKMIPNENIGYDVGSAQPKFSNYHFDTDEFSRLVNVAYDHVVNHDAFKSKEKRENEEL